MGRRKPESLTMARTSRNVSWALVGNVMSPLAGFISAPILAQALGVDGRGEVAAATAPLLLCIGALTLGLPEASTYLTAKYKAEVRAHLPRSAVMIVTVAIIGTILVIAASPLLASGREGLSFLISIAAIALPPALLLALIRGLTAGYGRWKLIALERALNSGSRLVALVVLSLFGALTPLSATVVLAAASFVGILAYVGLLVKPRTRSHSTDDAGVVPSALRYGMGVWFGSLSGILLTRIDQVLLVPLSSTYELGLYAISVSVAEVVLVFNAAVRDVMFSSESESPSGERLAQATRISTLGTLMLAIAVGLASLQGVPLLFGEDFRAAVPVVLVLLVAIWVGNPGSVAGAGLSARGRPGLRSWSLFVALVANIVAMLFLVPYLGALGAALATLVGNAVAGYMNIIWLRLKFAIPLGAFFGVRRRDFHLVRMLVGQAFKRRAHPDRGPGPEEAV